MAGIFDSKIFNAEVFGRYVETISDLRRNQLLKSGALVERRDIAQKFSEQTGGNYALVPMKDYIGGTADNYDGKTDINSTSRKTFAQGMIVVGRAAGFQEKDFSYDITGKNDFLPLAGEIAHYKDNLDQDTLLAILKGVFAMSTGTENKRFVSRHTYDITAATDKYVGASTLNSAIQKACGDNKGVFTAAIMHSTVATNLENLQLLQYLKYTDAGGIQRDLSMATWNGRMVLVDDNMPTEDIYTLSTDTSVVEGKTYYTKSGSSYVVVESPSGNPSTLNYYEITGTKYTTYVLGRGAIEYCDCGVKVPYEMDRNPAKNGGEETLYVRQRKLFAPRGISFETTSIPTSPTDAQLSTGSNWTLVNDKSTSTKKYIDDKHIPIARIISLG